MSYCVNALFFVEMGTAKENQDFLSVDINAADLSGMPSNCGFAEMGNFRNAEFRYLGTNSFCGGDPA